MNVNPYGCGWWWGWPFHGLGLGLNLRNQSDYFPCVGLEYNVEVGVSLLSPHKFLVVLHEHEQPS